MASATPNIERELDDLERRLAALRSRVELSALPVLADLGAAMVAELDDIAAKVAELRRQDAEEGTA